MSISHRVELGDDGSSRVALNIVGLDASSQEISRIYGALFAYDSVTGDSKFTSRLSIEDLRNLYDHLQHYSVIVHPGKLTTGTFLELPTEAEALRAAISLVRADELLPVLREVLASRLSRADISVILGRKDALEAYKTMLSAVDVGESAWQAFFEQNDWIFGYGLRYRFLSILQREAHVGGGSLDGAGVVVADFLLTDRRFTKLVEIKRPDTPLFKSRKNRSDSWRLSDELTDAVSQILAQQANWELESQRGPRFARDGNQIDETTIDVDCILVIGSLSGVSGAAQDRRVKLKTLELYRRNLRNVEIVTYDELYQRAEFIVSGGPTTAPVLQEPQI